MNEYIEVLRKYAVFQGRASRREYWMFALVNFLVFVVLGAISRQGLSVPLYLYDLAVIIPSFAVVVRRLHDIGRSAWWLLLYFLPIIGWIVIFVFTVQKSQPGQNAYGPQPTR